MSERLEERLRASYRRTHLPPVPAALYARLDELAATGRRPRPRIRLAWSMVPIAAALVVLLGALMIGTGTPAGTPAPSPSTGPGSSPSALAGESAAPAPVVARIPLPATDTMTPSWWAVAGGAIWVEDAGRAPTLVRIDAATARITAQVQLPYAVELVAGDGALWALGPLGNAGAGPLSETLSRVDLLTGESTKVAEIAGGHDLAVGLGGVFVVQADHLVRLDPATGTVTAILRVAAYAPVVACSDLLAWQNQDPSTDVLVRIDPSSGAVLWRENFATGLTRRIREVDGECWALASDQLTRVWPMGFSTNLSLGAEHIQAAGDAFWLWQSDDTLQRFNPYGGAFVGPVWTIDQRDLQFNPKAGNDSQLLSAGGALWLINPYELVRFDISTAALR